MSQDGFLVHGQVVPKVVLVFLEDGPVFHLEEKVFGSALVLDDLFILLEKYLANITSSLNTSSFDEMKV